jgi:osmoprotectant transport system substrate-binding protein/osmoprotectant transport system permease protein
MDDRIASAFRVLPDYLGQHVVLSASALALGIALSLPLAVLAARRPSLRWPILAAAGLIQTIPGLALLALFYPLLLALSALSLKVLGLGFPALGFLPALLALTLYSMLPILRNGVTGLTGVDPAVREAADGVGMTARQRLWLVEAPLALPVVMAGIRTAAVWTIGAATLSTPVGQTSLGNYIFSGLQTENWVWVLFGCVAAAVVAMVTDQLLGLIESGAARRDRRRVIIGLAGFAIGLALAIAPLLAGKRETYVIGAKNFSEQFILAEVIGDRLEGEGASVRRRDGLGSAVIFRALAAGEIDAYVDYSGTLWANVMGRRDTVPRARMLTEITTWMREREQVTVLGSLGFENAYVLAMKADRAKADGVGSIVDLAARAPSMTLGSDLEFLSRPEWAGLRDAYGLRFRAERSYNPTFMYRALQSGEADVISAFSSDGRMAALGLVALSDPKGAAPSYDAVILISPKRADDPVLRRALQPLIGRIRVEQMRQANLMVDRDAGKASPAQAAAWLQKASGLR